MADDELCVGYVRAFSALQATILRRCVVAIVSIRLSVAGSGIRFAVLKVQQERLDEIDGDQSYLAE